MKKAPLKVDETEARLKLYTEYQGDEEDILAPNPNSKDSEENDDLKGASTKELTIEFLKRLKVIENEIKTLQEDKKELEAEFKEKIDMKTLKQALKVHKVLIEVEHETTYEEMMDLLEKEMGSL